MKHVAILLLLSPLCSLHAQTTGGPDNFGYVWHDSNDPQGPVFNWIDIDTLPGTVTVTGLTDDNLSGPFNMPIAFQYYGGFPAQFYVGSNGYIKFLPGVGGIAYPFPHIPEPANTDHFIAPFLTDLTFIDNNSDTIPGASCKYWASPAADTMVITFSSVPFWFNQLPSGYTGLNTFQIILSATDQSIVFQYLVQNGVSLLGPSGFIVTGIEDHSGTNGLEVLYDVYPAAGSAYRFSVVDINRIEGKLYADLNSNGIQDASEPPVGYHRITETATGRFNLSLHDGSYFIGVTDTGNFQFIPDAMTNPYFTSVPATHSAYFPSLLLTDSLNDFAFQPNQVVNDLAVTITPTTPFRPGFPAGYRVTCYNEGTTVLIPEVTFYPDNGITFDSSNPAPTATYPDSIQWTLPAINPFETASIDVSVLVDSSQTIGSMVNSSARVDPTAGDFTPFNNQAWWEVTVTGSMDPNDILVSRDTIFTSELTSPPFIDYIIRFQNTGTDTAFNVRVMNPLPAELETGTLEIVETSHPMEFTWFSGINTAQYLFRNILLPDSNVNEPESHGFIRYRIKPLSSLAAGTVIRDSAGIYFDYNLPVITNTALTRIVLPVSVGEIQKAESIIVYPNPVIEVLHIRLPVTDHVPVEVKLTDLYGQTVIWDMRNTSDTDSYETELSVGGLADGVYVLEIIRGEKIFQQKIVKIR